MYKRQGKNRPYHSNIALFSAIFFIVHVEKEKNDFLIFPYNLLIIFDKNMHIINDKITFKTNI